MMQRTRLLCKPLYPRCLDAPYSFAIQNTLRILAIVLRTPTTHKTMPFRDTTLFVDASPILRIRTVILNALTYFLICFACRSKICGLYTATIGYRICLPRLLLPDLKYQISLYLGFQVVCTFAFTRLACNQRYTLWKCTYSHTCVCFTGRRLPLRCLMTY